MNFCNVAPCRCAALCFSFVRSGCPTSKHPSVHHTLWHPTPFTSALILLHQLPRSHEHLTHRRNIHLPGVYISTLLPMVSLVSLAFFKLRLWLFVLDSSDIFVTDLSLFPSGIPLVRDDTNSCRRVAYI